MNCLRLHLLEVDEYLSVQVCHIIISWCTCNKVCSVNLMAWSDWQEKQTIEKQHGDIVSLQKKIKALETEKEALIQANKALTEDKERYQVMSCSYQKPLRKLTFFTSWDGGAAKIFFSCLFCISLLWPPYEIGGPLYFCRVVTVFLSIVLSFFSSPNLSVRRLDVYHTSTRGVALVWI